jgi:hypothetical protein
MANPGFIRSFKAATDIPAYHVMKFSANNGEISLAAQATDPIVGISTSVDSGAGQEIGVILSQSADLKWGGPIAFGEPVTSDAGGCGVKAQPNAGETVRIIGFAMADAVQDDIAPVLISPGYLKGETPQA